MAKRHQELLARLDPIGLNRYQIRELESEIGVFLLEADRVEAARQVLAQLKGELS